MFSKNIFKNWLLATRVERDAAQQNLGHIPLLKKNGIILWLQYRKDDEFVIGVTWKSLYLKFQSGLFRPKNQYYETVGT